MHDLFLLWDCLITAADDGGEQRVWSMLGEPALDSTGLIGMPVYCGNHTQQGFSRVYNNAAKLPLFVSCVLSQSTSTALQRRAWCWPFINNLPNDSQPQITWEEATHSLWEKNVSWPCQASAGRPEEGNTVQYSSAHPTPTLKERFHRKPHFSTFPEGSISTGVFIYL